MKLYRIHIPQDFNSGIRHCHHLSDSGLSLHHKGAADYAVFISGLHYCALTFEQLANEDIICHPNFLAGRIRENKIHVSSFEVSCSVIVEDQTFFCLEDVQNCKLLTGDEFLELHKKSDEIRN